MDIWRVGVDNGVATGDAELVHRNIGRMLPRGISANGNYYYHQTVGAVDV